MKRLIGALLITLIAPMAAFAAKPERQVRDWNLRISPLGALIGMVDLNLDYRIGPNMTVGPTLSYLNLSILDVTVKGTSFGVEGNYFFSGVFTDGGYVDFGLNTMSIEASARSNSTGETAKATGSGLAYFAGIGYAWFWESFNLNLGLNVGGTTMNKIEVKDSTGTTIESYNGNLSTGLDFKIGFVF